MPRSRSAPATRFWRPWTRLFGVGVGVLLFAISFLMIDAWAAFGSKPAGERLDRIAQSPQYQEGRFHNSLPRTSDGFSVGTAWEFFTGGSDHRTPEAALPVVTRAAGDFAGPVPALRVTWFGHSTLLVEIEGARVLVDPVWSERASPSRFIGSPRFYAPPLALEALPAVDAVVISHDHYDHLDLPTVRRLAERVPRWIVPLGVGAHLEAWGVAPERVEELDWWEEVGVGSVRLVSTPARHFSGRFLTDRDATLWTGWAFLGAEKRVWYSGDTALTPQFTEVGERLGPFDLTLVEAGAYNAAWADVHLGPEQAVAAHRMVQRNRQGGLLVPVHWGLFDLALHGWTEPAERIRAAAQAAGVAVAFPRPGESLTLDAAPTDPWWPALPWQTASEAPVVSTALPDAVLALIPTPRPTSAETSNTATNPSENMNASADSTASSEPMTLFTFEGPDAARWDVENDGVMGGRSQGFVELADGILRFTGEVVTEGGGFTSVRAARQVDLSSYDGIELRVRGGGRTFELDVDDGTRSRGREVNRRGPFPTSDAWQTVRVPFASLEASAHGEPVNVDPLDLSAVQSIGIYIIDGNDGPFRLEVDWIRAYRAAE